MLNITLVCSAGMSTSMLMERMKDAASTKGIEVKMQALSESELKNNLSGTDILLLGPQVRYMISGIRASYSDKIPVIEVINMSDYGLMNGTKVLEDALSLYNKK
jgi:PTS system cellobiose-specific IIB component